ncbi:Putative rRNA methylase [Granulicatella balaenopterae]|uniref:Putative rRNA methylase n=1 Tax=Granulicatella balaenopterae TaxID=137733 RepID=A0A1H9HQM1_9LACT|nr:class I SAM-dependent methyltransferase [Granulicatella balaenopterae]SEQ64634.1 Putative rRNA methylase [Granulicatella balaenopterae]
MQNSKNYSHTLLREIISIGDTVIDATCGNGNDTLFMAQLIGKSGQVLAFDIQQQAINNTLTLIQQNNCDKQVSCIKDSHSNLPKYIDSDTKIKAAIFNLGYLPKSDKSIITLPKSTIAAINSIQDYLIPGGRIVIVAYYGHQNGQEELDAISTYLSQQDQQDWSVLQYQFINQKNCPPICFCLEKKQKNISSCLS